MAGVAEVRQKYERLRHVMDERVTRLCGSGSGSAWAGAESAAPRQRRFASLTLLAARNGHSVSLKNVRARNRWDAFAPNLPSVDVGRVRGRRCRVRQLARPADLHVRARGDRCDHFSKKLELDERGRKTWTEAGPSIQAKITVSGLTAGTTHYFRNR